MVQSSNHINIFLKLWTSPYVWARKHKNILLMSDVNNFDDYMTKRGTYFKLPLPIDNDQWKDGACMCPMFLKNYICKHLLGTAIRCKFVCPPPEAKNLEIGMKRKRGRPSKATTIFTSFFFIFLF